MGSLVLWAVLILVLGVASAATVTAVESIWRGGLLAGVRARVLALVSAAVGLAVLGLLLKIHAVASADGDLVRLASHSRSATLIGLTNLVTTMGDTVPSLVLAAALSVVLFRQGRHPVLSWVLPVLVVIELLVQIGMGHLFNDLTIADVAHGVQVRDHGYLPSGSVARLSSLLLVTAMLWTGSAGARRRLGTVAVLLVLVQAVTRLYLGRHLVLDIVGGLVLGLALAVAVSFVPGVGSTVEHQSGDEQEQ